MKKFFYIGALLGGILGVIVALGMDLVLGKSLGGGWQEAVANDLNRLLGTNYGGSHPVVIIGVIGAIGLIAAFGALMGGFSLAIIARILKTLSKEKH